MLFAICAAAALVPLVLGFIWYHPKVFGTAWLKVSGTSDEKLPGGKMALIFGLSFVLSFMLALAMSGIVIHQSAISSLLIGSGMDFADPTTEAGAFYAEAKRLFGGVNRSFGHGALHGTLAGFFISLPILGTNALFERKGFKYIAINCGYWIICLALMGGVICQFAPGMR